MRIQHNIMAMNAYRNYNTNNSALSKNLEKLSSGYAINRAGDDAAGLAISEKMRAQITGLDVAQKNANDGISLVQTAEGAMTEVHDMLNRMVELANQSANGTYDATDRVQLQKEIVQLKDEIDRIADSSNFNGINLLDGSLEAQDLTAAGITFDSATVTDGLTIDQGKNGGGSKGEYTVTLDGLLSTGDKLDIKFSDASLGTSGTFSISYGSNKGSDVTANTVEEQAKEIADILNKNAGISQKFEVKADGNKITLVSKEEGSGTAAVEEFTATDSKVTFGTGAITDGADDAQKAVYGWDNIFGTGTGAKGIELKAGDELEFTFKNQQGTDIKVKLTVTDKMIGDTVDKTTENIVNALKGMRFEDVASTTGVDESQFKVEDLFTLAANTKNDGTADATAHGSIQVTAKFDGQFQATSLKHFRDGAEITGNAATATQQTPGKDGTTANKFEVTGGSDNFSYGDVLELKGKLADNREFVIKLTAGVDFEIGADYEATMNNLKGLLEGTGSNTNYEITFTDGSTEKASDIFGAGKEIQITAGAGTMSFESADKGTLGNGIASGVTEFKLFKPGESFTTSEDLVEGTAKSAAESSFTLGEGLEYGTAIKIGDKTYEIVKDARDVTNRNNQAIVVDDLTNVNDIADKLVEQLNKDGAGTFTAQAQDGKVTIKTVATGSDVKAIEVSTPYGDEVNNASFKFDPSKIKENSYFTFNGNTYEFVKAGEKPLDSSNIAIEVDDFSNVTSKELADKFAAVATNGNVSVADDGTVTVTSYADENGNVPKPEINFYDGLTLQIGDTSDTFNQLTVGISDMHAASIGIANIDISTQKGAQNAVDVIKQAINKVSDVRGTLGATQNRLEHTINNLSVNEENIQNAESAIRDTDVAEEMMAYTKNNILIQSAQAMLAQANQVPQGVLQLLG